VLSAVLWSETAPLGADRTAVSRNSTPRLADKDAEVAAEGAAVSGGGEIVDDAARDKSTGTYRMPIAPKASARRASATRFRRRTAPVLARREVETDTAQQV
jgi:hypothetical protein